MIQITNRSLLFIYSVIAAVGFCFALSVLLSYLHLGAVGGTIAFWQDTMVNPASRFITIDIILFAFSVLVLWFVEARKIGLGATWIAFYWLLAVLYGVSFSFPLFLVHRQVKVLKTEGNRVIGELALFDIGLLLSCVCTLALYGLLAFHVV